AAPLSPAPRAPSLHDALPIVAAQEAGIEVIERRSGIGVVQVTGAVGDDGEVAVLAFGARVVRIDLPGPGVSGIEQAVELGGAVRSEEHTSELQSRENLVCRLL